VRIRNTRAGSKGRRGNPPSATSFARGRWVAATILTSTWTEPLFPRAAARRSPEIAAALPADQGYLANFVEEERNRHARLQCVPCDLHSAGEGAARVAKKLRFEQAFGNRRAVQSDQLVR